MNKKVILCSAVLALSAIGLTSNAQLSQGGLPLTLQKGIELAAVPMSTFETPNWDAFLEKEKLESKQFAAGPIQVGLPTAADFGFPQSGQMIVADGGIRVWRGIIHVANAPAMTLYFDKFHLPKGVRLFFTNENRRQVVGAFDAANNTDDKLFAVDAVQGEKVFVELNIEPGVDINQIEMHINSLLIMHRAIEHLSFYTIGDLTPIDGYDAQYNGLSSSCMINAICATEPLAVNPRKATVQTIYAQGGACSGTLVNNTGNSPGGECKTLIATATHCQPSGATNPNSEFFSMMLVRFNFERPDCQGTQPTNGRTLTGTTLLARSQMQNSWVSNVSNILADHMLLELKTAVPASYGAVLSGWKANDALIATNVAAPKSIIGFHHPVADNKKVSKSQSIYASAWPSQQPSASGTRWTQLITSGYVSPGSSGSGLFDSDGYLIGIASVAGDMGGIPASCQIDGNGQPVQGPPFNAIIYQKISGAWTFTGNGVANANNLKPFLDPTNSGLLKLNSVAASTCTPLTSGGGTDAGGNTSVNSISDDLNANIAVYPNPNTTGMINLQFNLKDASDLDIKVVDVTGKVVFSSMVKSVMAGTNTIDLSHLSSGVYMLKLSSNQGFATKKIVLSK
jgi:hypothetical protein